MKTKISHREWYQQIIKQDSSKFSPVLGIRFDPTLINGNKKQENWIPFTTKSGWGASGYIGDMIYFKDEPTVTSANRLEATLLQLVARTNYNNFPDKNRIECGRYIVNLSKAQTIILVKLFDYVFKSKSKKTSKTWLEPLQLLILEQQTKRIAKPKRKIKAHYNPSLDELEEPFPVHKPALKYTVQAKGLIIDMSEPAQYGNEQSKVLTEMPAPAKERSLREAYSDKRLYDIARARAENLLRSGDIGLAQVEQETHKRYLEVKLREKRRNTEIKESAKNYTNPISQAPITVENLEAILKQSYKIVYDHPFPEGYPMPSSSSVTETFENALLKQPLTPHPMNESNQEKRKTRGSKPEQGF